MRFRNSKRGAGAAQVLGNINILLVEDSRTYQEIITTKLEETFAANITVCANYEEVLDCVVSNPNQYDIAMTDLNVPGAPNGEVMDELLSRSIPTIVFTGTFSEEVRDRMLSRRVVDYVVKDSPDSVSILAETARKALLNRYSRILVVDDQKTTQSVMVSLLEQQLYQVHAVYGGEEALHLLKQGQEFDLVITDYNMPGMNGDELTARIRKGGYGKNMRILGVSSTGNSLMSAQFLKAGANDFMQRPFAAEEFHWRVGENVETVRLVHKLNGMAQTDFLTNVYNRRYLFNEGAETIAQAHKAGAKPAVVMFDLDHFKSFNDQYGYAIGDKVLKTIASVTMDLADADDKLVVRLGGEEFGVFIADGGLEAASALAEQIRTKIANTPLQANGKSIRLSASFGVAQFAPGEKIDSVLNVADVYLHEAKDKGRNCVVCQPANAVKQSA